MDEELPVVSIPEYWVALPTLWYAPMDTSLQLTAVLAADLWDIPFDDTYCRPAPVKTVSESCVTLVPTFPKFRFDENDPLLLIPPVLIEEPLTVTPDAVLPAGGGVPLVTRTFCANET